MTLSSSVYLAHLQTGERDTHSLSNRFPARTLRNCSRAQEVPFPRFPLELLCTPATPPARQPRMTTLVFLGTNSSIFCGRPLAHCARDEDTLFRCLWAGCDFPEDSLLMSHSPRCHWAINLISLLVSCSAEGAQLFLPSLGDGEPQPTISFCDLHLGSSLTASVNEQEASVDEKRGGRKG